MQLHSCLPLITKPNKTVSPYSGIESFIISTPRVQSLVTKLDVNKGNGSDGIDKQNYYYSNLIKTHGHVSAAKKDVQHTIVLLIGTTKYPFSTPHISKTTIPISIEFIYFMPSINTTLHTKFEENRISSL